MDDEFPEPNWKLDPRPQGRPKILPSPRRARFKAEWRLLVDANGVGDLLGVSASQVRSFNDSGRLPLPIYLGASIRWNVKELEAWAAAGCPERSKWINVRGTR